VWLNAVPWAIRSLLNYVAKRYNDPEIMITENGVSAPGEAAKELKDQINDKFRLHYYR
jgi:beta-glucosidase/6-phospho-beta-glucosidase/beta-galactosidase